ncbi:MAG: NAD(P)H-dependent oxidoreductase subunit E [Defluviitaleaceae bacterium]|nr:NAD(P)H-dependent oxidoreductase subunit E [Defluviitaleaceae bacterium]
MDNNFTLLDEFIQSLPTKQGSLIAVLHKAQEIFGYLPEEVQDFVAEKLEIPAAAVYGVVTFYSFFTMDKKGKFRISVCMGTACFVKGAQDILDEFLRILKIPPGGVTEDGIFSVDALRCIGACGLAPVITVNGKYYGRLKKADVKRILDEMKGACSSICDAKEEVVAADD